MIKTFLGIEIGNFVIKFAVCSDNKVKDFVVERLPDNIVRDGNIVSWEVMTDFIKENLKKHRISCKYAAVVLPESSTYVRRIFLPYMTVDQLQFNLPYEFHDFITEEKDQYFYDYAVVGMVEEEKNGKISKSMDLMAAAVSKEIIEKYRYMLKRCGLKLKVAAPESSAYQNVIRKHLEITKPEKPGDYALLNIGHDAVSLWIFTDGIYETGKKIELGLGAITKVIAETLGVDEHIAEIYKHENHNNVIYSEECVAIYGQIAWEVMRVINFFNYNHPSNTLDTLYCCGGGVKIEPLMEILGDTLDLKVKSIDELFDGIIENKDAMVLGAAAVGITWN